MIHSCILDSHISAVASDTPRTHLLIWNQSVGRHLKGNIHSVYVIETITFSGICVCDGTWVTKCSRCMLSRTLHRSSWTVLKECNLSFSQWGQSSFFILYLEQYHQHSLYPFKQCLWKSLQDYSVMDHMLGVRCQTTQCSYLQTSCTLVNSCGHWLMWTCRPD